MSFIQACSERGTSSRNTSNSVTLVGVIIWWGWDYAQRGKVQSMIGLEDVSMFWAYLAMPVGGVFCVFSILGFLIDPRRNELETQQ